ncbi:MULTISPECIES: restriction endonuclease subunit S [unclassified Rhizobium]|uniref:restriction endonuclease subunit S n=1 Tax=unclassified Rhizobium TaxID=2613769 RepID=UPI001ADAB962|nr:MULTISPECIES: restriction endonuclease subunit S [unclassified Rhizobium]MBO9122220.1 restriction endonuclease subunit S [Rhizobium sp. 16-488-2b]MBO9172710.1 restriction endonuclease subunit S [Rhizobium sp. 16-488-2a]
MVDAQWNDCLLGDLITLQRGYDITKKEQSEGPYPVVSSSGPTSTHIAYTDVGPGVVIGRKGTLGKAFYVHGPYWAHDTTLWVKNFRGNDRKFVFYLLQSMNLATYDVGSSNPTLNRNHLHLLPVRAPDVVQQQRIADVLSAYDDLVEVNQQRITILEDMARRLFDEWFVRFRYPGHEAVPLVETELGMVPRGWIIGSVSILSSFISRGIAPKYDDEACSIAINQKCIRDRALNLLLARRQSKSVPQSKLLVDGDIVVNSTGVGTLGRVAQLLGTVPNATADGHVTIVRAADHVDLHYFGLQLLQLQPHFERQGVGATGQTELSKAAIADTKISIAPSDLATRFGRVAGPIRGQAELLRNQNNKLRAARGLLLPKLVSGQIDVSTAEETFAEAAE